jgi:hypothetical protein
MPKSANPIPDAETLHSLFIYDDGKLLRKKPNGTTCIAGFKRKKDGYMQVKIAGVSYLMHRVIWCMFNDNIDVNLYVDHMNGVRDDNRIDNLRVVDCVSNMQNRRKAQVNSGTGLIGSCVHKGTGRYEAQISHYGNKIYIGLYDTPEEAHQAYLKKKRELHKTCTI